MKKLINTTLSDIEVDETGITIPASGEYVLNEQEFLLLATSDSLDEIEILLNSGDLVANDGVDNLSATDGLNYLRYPDRALSVRFAAEPERSNNFNAKNVQEAIEEIRGDVRGKLLEFEYKSVGSTFNKWLNIGHPSTGSDIIPLVAAWSGKAIGLTYANSNDQSDIDVEVYVNSVLAYTWDIRSKRTSYNVLDAGFFSVNQGDNISMYARRVDGGLNPSSIVGEVILQVETMPDGEGGADIGV